MIQTPAFSSVSLIHFSSEHGNYYVWTLLNYCKWLYLEETLSSFILDDRILKVRVIPFTKTRSKSRTFLSTHTRYPCLEQYRTYELKPYYWQNLA